MSAHSRIKLLERVQQEITAPYAIPIATSMLDAIESAWEQGMSDIFLVGDGTTMKQMRFRKPGLGSSLFAPPDGGRFTRAEWRHTLCVLANAQNITPLGSWNGSIVLAQVKMRMIWQNHEKTFFWMHGRLVAPSP